MREQGKARVRVAVGVVGSLTLAVLLGWAWINHHRIVIKNVGALTLDSLVIETRHDTIRFEGLKPGEQRSRLFTIRGDDSFMVSGRYAGGKEFRSQQGYVCRGMMNVRVDLSVGDDGNIIYTDRLFGGF